MSLKTQYLTKLKLKSAKLPFTPFQNIIGGRQPTGGRLVGTKIYRSIFDQVEVIVTS